MDSPIDLIISEVGCETPVIRRIRLRPADGLSLPGWELGAHVNVQLPDGDQRSYSLRNLSAALTAAPESYALGARLDCDAAFGSIQLFM
jgi:ferredoxin-NADP reductase